MERDKKADGALTNPLADAIAGGFLDSGDQGGVVNDAVEDLAGWGFGGGAQRGRCSVGFGPQWEVFAHHGRNRSR